LTISGKDGKDVPPYPSSVTFRKLN
jgi:hypothetical protein